MTRYKRPMVRGSSPWLNAVHYPTPEQNLLAAVVKSAARDVRRGCDADRATARAYLFGPNFEIDAAVLGIDAQRVRRLLQEELAQ